MRRRWQLWGAVVLGGLSLALAQTATQQSTPTATPTPLIDVSAHFRRSWSADALPICGDLRMRREGRKGFSGVFHRDTFSAPFLLRRLTEMPDFL
eukprot:scaffold327_cov257-Pinguiococcus_pyrenoidosus.AAC.21